MAKYFPNVYIDGCWLTHISPTGFKRGLTEWLETVPMNKIFAWDPREDEFTYYGRSHVLEEVLSEQDITMEELNDEWERRALILNWMARKKIEHYSTVAQIIRDYYAAPDQTYDRARRELKTV